MIKRVRYIIGTITAAALLWNAIQQPVLTVSAAEISGEESAPQETAGPDDVQEPSAAPESSEAVSGEESAPQETAGPDDVQEPSAAPESFEPAIPEEGIRTRSSGSLDEETAEWIEAAGEALAQIAGDRDIMALVYLQDEYPVRREPSYGSEAAVTVLSGHTVNILDMYVDEDNEIWEYVRLDYKGEEVYGYVPRIYLACSDSRFLAWEKEYGLDFLSATYAIDENGNVTYPDIEQFPESYRPALLALKEKHPTWSFAKMNTNLDWQTVIDNELKNSRSLVYKTFPDWAKEGLYDSGNWYFASEAVLKLYMDPRNGLTENAIFQFEQLTYNEECHTLEALTSFLSGTFMSEDHLVPETVMSYPYVIYMIGREECREVSPFHLAARILQEQGTAGTSPLISGTYPGYEGYYNYFNIGATGKTNKQVIESGLQYAKDHWEKGGYFAIWRGADFISANYIKKGQDSLYLEKYNVNPNSAYPVYTHQYMQNISAPTTEAQSIRKLYANANALDSTFVFKIPVYRNMPEEPCGEPRVSTNVVLELPEGYSDTTMWLDGVPYEGELRNGRLIAAAPDGNAKSAVIYRYNSSGIPVGMYVWSLVYNGMSYTATPEPELQDLLTYHGFSIRITGKKGIRFKTGISVDLRAKLTTTGVNGYKLKEYGTLVMNNVNRKQYPMVKGGTKVVEGLSYGADGNGNFRDTVFEAVDGRYRYTSVLVGLPASQYKTEFAFRGYIILEKNGTQIILYGPARASSIYQLAVRLIEGGSYAPGTDAYEFLRNLIDDADALERQKNPEEQEETAQQE